jgi:hypothetical protein
VAPGLVDHVARAVVADVGTGEPETEREGDSAVDDEAASEIARRVPVDHRLVAVHLRRVVEHPREEDVLVGDDAAAGMLDRVARTEVLEVGVVVRQVSELRIGGAVPVGRNEGLDLDRLGLQLSGADLPGGIALEDLDLALVGNHELAGLLGAEALHVHDSPVGIPRRGRHAEHGRLDLDRVANMDRRPEAHVDVLEVGASVLRDVFDGLAERDRHDQPRGSHQPLEAVRLRVTQVLVQRVGRHREVGEVRQQSLVHGPASLVPEDLAHPEVLEKVPCLLSNHRHG